MHPTRPELSSPALAPEEKTADYAADSSNYRERRSPGPGGRRERACDA